jgi:hypothetical protein
MIDISQVTVIGEFLKFGDIVGLELRWPDGTAAKVHFSYIFDKMDAQWNRVKADQAALWEWWCNQAIKTSDIRRQYEEQDAELQAEQKRLETLLIELRNKYPQFKAVAYQEAL